MRLPTMYIISTILSLSTLLLANNLVSGQDTAWLATDYPNPSTDPTACRVGKENLWMCDPDAVLTAPEVSEVLTTMRAVNQVALCACNCTLYPDNGYVIGVAVVGAMQATQDDAAFSQTVKDAWFKTSECDDKALLLLNKKTSQIYINLGSRLSELVPSSDLDTIYSDAQPLLQQTPPQYRDALKDALSNLAFKVSESLEPAQMTGSTPSMTTEAPEPENNLVWGILGVLAILSILVFHYWIKY